MCIFKCFTYFLALLSAIVGGCPVVLCLQYLCDSVGTCPPTVAVSGQENRLGTQKSFP